MMAEVGKLVTMMTLIIVERLYLAIKLKVAKRLLR